MAGERRRNMVERALPGWHVAMAIMIVVSVVVTMATPRIDTAARVTVLATLAVMAGVYTAMSLRPGQWPSTRWSLGYLIVLCGGLFVVLASGVDLYFFLPLAYGQLWLVCRGSARDSTQRGDQPALQHCAGRVNCPARN